MFIKFSPQFRGDSYELARLVEYEDTGLMIAIDGEAYPILRSDVEGDPPVQPCVWVSAFDGESLTLILPYDAADALNPEFTFPAPVEVEIFDIIPLPVRAAELEPDPPVWTEEET